jgi:hypothetical protein
MDTAPEVNLEPPFEEISDEDDVRIWQATKPIHLSALLTVDRYQRPAGGQITSIRALDDDPGHAVRRAALRSLERLGGLSPEMLKGVRESSPISRLTPDMLKAFRESSPISRLTPDMLKAFRESSPISRLSPDMLKAFRGFRGVPREVWDALRRVQDQADQGWPAIPKRGPGDGASGRAGR